MSMIRAKEIERNGTSPTIRITCAWRATANRTRAPYSIHARVHRRQQCETVFNIFGTAQPRAARSAAESLV